jgi:hypothetical protein
MKAEALAQERHVLAEDAFVEVVVWRVRSLSRARHIGSSIA